ncbi:hypothetical protein NW765_017618 [Fusarium oxysporum]|nr:hypothetical protein NW765_017618 [Fusarium oxysporum]
MTGVMVVRVDAAQDTAPSGEAGAGQGQQGARRTHTQYSCGVCGRAFDRKDTASRHMQIHDRRHSMASTRRKACVHCIRCSSEQPSCSSCLKRDLPCVYESRRRQNSETAPLSNKDDQHTHSTNDESAHDAAVTAAASLPSPCSAWRIDRSSVGHVGDDQLPTPDTTERMFDMFPTSDFPDLHDQMFGFGNELGPQFGDNGSLWMGPSPGSLELFQQILTAGPDPLTQTQAQSPSQTQIETHAQTQGQTPKDQLPPGHCLHSKDKGPPDCLPSPEYQDVPSPQDPWPMDQHVGPTQQLVLPPINGGFRQPGKHFSTPNVDHSMWAALQRCVKLPSDQSPWPSIDLSAFPEKETIDHCIDLYFAHFHQMYPIIHRPTFVPEESAVLTLGIVSVGACFSGIAGCHAFANSLSELNRRLLVFLAENNRAFVRTESYLTAQLLQSLQGYCSGHERLFELSEAGRNAMVHNAKCMGLFQDTKSSEPPASTLDEAWRQWIRQEKLRRLGWAVYEFDSVTAYVHNGRPNMNIAEAVIALPCSVDEWEAGSACAWSALRRSEMSTPTGLRLTPTLQSLLDGSRRPADACSNEHERLIFVLALGKIMWSLNESASFPIDRLVIEGLSDAQKRVLEVLDGFVQFPTAMWNTHTKKQVARAVHTTHLIHMTHVYGAGELMSLIFPLIRHMLHRRMEDSREIKTRLRQWAARNPRKVRTVAHHCAQALALVRQFPENLTIEPFTVFHAGLALMVTARLMPTNHPGHVQSQSLRIDHLGTPEDPICQSIDAWVENGGDEVLSVHGVPAICSDEGSRQLLEETAEALQRTKVWGIAQNLFNIVMQIRAGDMNFNFDK